MGKYELLPAVAGALGLTSFGTLVWRVYQTHNTTSLPYSWILLNLSAQILAGTYGVLNGAWGIYGPSSVFIAGLIYVLYVKYFEQTYPKKPVNGDSAPQPPTPTASGVAQEPDPPKPNYMSSPTSHPKAFNSML
jgi:hypothetical protein